MYILAYILAVQYGKSGLCLSQRRICIYTEIGLLPPLSYCTKPVQECIQITSWFQFADCGDMVNVRRMIKSDIWLDSLVQNK